MQIENEIKFKISKPNAKLMKKITGLGFEAKKDAYQEDHYFSPPHKNFFGTKKYYFRLRKKSDGSAVLAYHVVVSNLQTKELETMVDNFVVMKTILNKLNFKLDCVVKKKRRSFINNEKNIELVLDNVVGLGDFLEIEYVGKMTKTASNSFYALINELGLSKKQIVSGCGYPDLLAEKNYVGN